MLAKRVIASVLVRGKTAFKGPGFGELCTRSVGSAVSICRTHAMRGIDELMILDIGATDEGRGPDLDLVRELSADCFVPITVGGGVRRLQDIDALLRAGADKVAVCSVARESQDFVGHAADRFGAQAIVVVIEHGVVAPGDHARYVIPHSAGEIMLQHRERDSTMRGYDLAFLAQVASTVTVPLIVSGGCSGPQDMLEALRAGADACAAGALFQFTDCTPRDCAEFLRARGVEVRT